MIRLLRRFRSCSQMPCVAGAMVLLCASGGCSSPPRHTAPVATAPERTGLPAKKQLPLTGTVTFFGDRVLVALRVDPMVRPDDESPNPDDPKGSHKGGPGAKGGKKALSGGLQVQGNNGGTQVSSSVAYNVGGANVGASVGSGGFGGLNLGFGNGGGNKGAGGQGQGGRRPGRLHPGPNAPTAAPAAALRLTFTNRSAERLDLYIVDLLSPFGSFTVRPGHLALEPEQTVEAEPLYSFECDDRKSVEVTLVLRTGDERENGVVVLHDTTAPAESAPAATTTPATP